MSIRTTVSFHKALSFALIALLTTMSATYGSGQSRPQNDATAEKIRSKVTKVGTGKRSRAEVIFKDDRKLKGYVGEISENGFTLVDPNRGTVTTISYENVRQFKSRNHDGRNLAFVGAGMVGAIVFALVLATGAR